MNAKTMDIYSKMDFADIKFFENKTEFLGPKYSN